MKFQLLSTDTLLFQHQDLNIIGLHVAVLADIVASKRITCAKDMSGTSCLSVFMADHRSYPPQMFFFSSTVCAAVYAQPEASSLFIASAWQYSSDLCHHVFLNTWMMSLVFLMEQHTVPPSFFFLIVSDLG